MSKFILLFCVVLLPFISVAQDLNCQISVSSREIEGSDKEVFNTLQTALYEFMNGNKWTPYNVEINERLEVTMLINIKERVSQTEFSATLNIVASRPVFNSAYNSAIFNYIDDEFSFTYTENEPITYADNSYTSNLTSVMAFYTYFLYGMEFETMQLNGGSDFFDKANSVINLAQSSSEKGWKAFDSDKNRYWLAENMMNPAYKNLHTFLYAYHRTGLDLMADDVQTGRANILRSLDELKKAYDERPGLFMISLILDAKRNEIINIFSEAPINEKQKVVELMKEIDPAQSTQYQKLLE